MVGQSLKDRVVGPLPNSLKGAYKWGVTNQFPAGMILQALENLCNQSAIHQVVSAWNTPLQPPQG